MIDSPVGGKRSEPLAPTSASFNRVIRGRSQARSVSLRIAILSHECVAASRDRSPCRNPPGIMVPMTDPIWSAARRIRTEVFCYPRVSLMRQL